MLTFGTTASEQMYFDGAPLAHVVHYYDRLRQERLQQSLAIAARRRIVKPVRFASIQSAL